jgi:hypothetical protein
MTQVGSAMGKSLPTFCLPGFRAYRRHSAALVACVGLFALCGPGSASASAVPAPSGPASRGTAKPTVQRRAVRTSAVQAALPSAQIASVPGKPIAGRLFAPNSVWNESIATNTPIDPSSAKLVSRFAAQAATEGAAGTGPFVQTYNYTTPIYVVGPFQRTVRVAIDTDQTRSWVTSLQGASDAVPVPARAEAAAGTDSQITIYQPSTNRLWEYWHFRHERDGWHARWGGAIDDVSGSPGYYTPASWSGALSIWGASATSLPLVAGTMTLAELRSGEIDHALAMSIPYPRAGVAAWPAQRSDGTGSAAELPEGAHLRLSPRLDIRAMHLPKIVEMMALAAQRYGIIVRDQTHADIGFYAEDPAQYGDKPGTASDPYYGLFRDSNGKPDPQHGSPDPHALFDGMWPSTFFRFFPWRSLQVLKMSLHSTT